MPGKTSRLRKEYEDLRKMERRSNFIKVEPIEVQHGHPPEKYVITYTCLGIKGIKEDGEPIPSDLHRVEMTLVDFPAKEPVMKWLTAIWHPNIEREGLRKVCMDNPKSWYPTKTLWALVRDMGEMVQYKSYHAKWISPYPADKQAAKWVRDYAEPNKIVGPEKPFDDRPLLRSLPIGPAEDGRSKRKPEPAPPDGSGKESGKGSGKPSAKGHRILFGEPEQSEKKKVVFGDPISDQ
jgi:ubiquitin-protein ligase